MKPFGGEKYVQIYLNITLYANTQMGVFLETYKPALFHDDVRVLSGEQPRMRL